jgi:hypothetical protein
MSCQSKHKLQDIKDQCIKKKLSHESGTHENGASRHQVRCINCGLPDTKNSKVLMGLKGGCR